MTDEEKSAMPILGNHIVWGGSSERTEAVATSAASEDDLPF
jgi:hypothetical protein